MRLMQHILLLITVLYLPLSFAQTQALPSKYTGLLDYVQEAPDQGESNTCLFVASTGAMELIANKKNGIKNPTPYGKFDLSESFLIHSTDYITAGKYYWEMPVLRFNRGYGIHITDWPYEAWDGTSESNMPWAYRNSTDLPKVVLPKVETEPVFVVGNKWSTHVLNAQNIEQIKDALWKHKAPVLVNYNDDGYWHVVLIVGYDDNIPGACYDVTKEECGGNGAFYVRDSFGIPVELRDYDWFRIQGNTAISVRAAP